MRPNYIFPVVVIFFLPISAMPYEYNNLMGFNTPDTINYLFDNSKIKGNLKSLLGKHYDEYISNFEDVAAPQKLENGLLVDGWLHELSLESSSVLVIQPNGNLYAAWLKPGHPKIMYVTNDNKMKGIQPNIIDWSKRFENVSFEERPRQDLSKNISYTDLNNAYQPFTGVWQGSFGETSTLTLTITQKGNQLTGQYCYVSRNGKRIDCPDKEDKNISGTADGLNAYIDFNSSFGGGKGKAVINLSGSSMSWKLLKEPMNSNFYAPETYKLSKRGSKEEHFSETKTFTTENFTIVLSNRCGSFFSYCEKMSYTGKRNKDGKEIQLIGKTFSDNKSYKIKGAIFIKGDVVYSVYYDQLRLQVIEDGKVILDQSGVWQNEK